MYYSTTTKHLMEVGSINLHSWEPAITPKLPWYGTFYIQQPEQGIEKVSITGTLSITGMFTLVLLIIVLKKKD